MRSACDEQTKKALSGPEGIQGRSIVLVRGSSRGSCTRFLSRWAGIQRVAGGEAFVVR